MFIRHAVTVLRGRFCGLSCFVEARATIRQDQCGQSQLMRDLHTVRVRHCASGGRLPGVKHFSVVLLAAPPHTKGPGKTTIEKPDLSTISAEEELPIASQRWSWVRLILILAGDFLGMGRRLALRHSTHIPSL